VGKRIYEKIEQTKINPLHFFKRLEGKSEFRLRIGKFRVLAEIDIKNKVIFVLDIGNRENIYN
jgi:mRNA interferase RelE/StbE